MNAAANVPASRGAMMPGVGSFMPGVGGFMPGMAGTMPGMVGSMPGMMDGRAGFSSTMPSMTELLVPSYRWGHMEQACHMRRWDWHRGKPLSEGPCL